VCEDDHLSPPSAEVKNEWRYTSTDPYILTWHGAHLSTGTLPFTCTHVHI